MTGRERVSLFIDPAVAGGAVIMMTAAPLLGSGWLNHSQIGSIGKAWFRVAIPKG